MSSTSAGIQVTEFVTALSRGWKKLAAYPPNHPEVVHALDAVESRLAALRGPAGDVVFGVTAHGLVYGSTDVSSAAARPIAQALYSRGVAILRLGSGTRRQELEIFLRLLRSRGVGDANNPIGDDLTAAGVMNINLQPVNYAAVHITDGIRSEPAERDGQPLWDEILRALLADQRFSSPDGIVPRQAGSAEDLARLIAQYAGDEDRDVPAEEGSTFGIRLTGEREEEFHRFFVQTVGHAITTTTGLKRQHSVEQAVQLLRSLPEQLRRPLIRAIAEALSSDESAAALLREFAAELPNNEVLDALRYLSSADRVSAQSLTLLEAMATIEGSGHHTDSDDVLGDVLRLFGENDAAGSNASDHDDTIRSIAASVPLLPPEATSGMHAWNEPVNPDAEKEILRHYTEVLFDISVDADAPVEPRNVFEKLDRNVPGLLASGEYDHVAYIVHRLFLIAEPNTAEPLRAAAEASLALISGLIVDKATDAEDAELHKIRPVLDALEGQGRQALLERLATEDNRSRRRRLMTFIAAHGETVVPQIRSYLSDGRWYVVRNMIVLLRAVKDTTSLPQLRKLAHHGDVRVRMEAVKSLFALDHTVPPTLLANLFNDRDPKVGQAAVALAGTARIKEAVEPLLSIVDENDYLGAKRPLRLKALRALGEIGDARALPRLQKFFAASLLPWPPREERYAAWTSLAGYPAAARARLLATGLKSSDAQVRAICSSLTEA